MDLWFRNRHLCENIVSELIGNVVRNLQEKKHTIAIFLDLSNAFDMLEHWVIFNKMEKYGIQGDCIKWYKSNLSNRELQVKCRTDTSSDETLSNKYSVKYGTPQGSYIGPLIFVIFCNDLSKNLDLISCIPQMIQPCITVVRTNNI